MSDGWPAPPVAARRNVSLTPEPRDEASAAGGGEAAGDRSASHARLLDETQAVVLELKDDIVRLQHENAELRRRVTGPDLGTRLRELQEAFDAAVEKHKKESKEARFRNLKLQQERQRLKQAIQDMEVELAAARKEPAPGAEKLLQLEAAVDELRKENAALREEKLAFMTCELKRLHPSDGSGDPQEEVARLSQALDSSVAELTTARQKLKDMQKQVEAKEGLLEQRTQEYEALLVSRRAELETMNVLSNSLSETQALYEAAQKELAKLQEENGELVSEKMLRTAKREGDARRGRDAGPSPGLTGPLRSASLPSSVSAVEKTAEELREELAVVKKTANGAISTLSASLKKALLSNQELCEEFEQNRQDMKQEYEAVKARVDHLEAENESLRVQKEEAVRLRLRAEEELAASELQMREQKQRTKEAKQRLKAEILDTKKLISTQLKESSSILDEDPEFMALLNIPTRAREALASPTPLLED